MDRAAWDFLISAAGRDLLAGLAAADLSENNLLPLLTRLRRDLPAEIAGAALTLARLRGRAAEKFSQAGSMFFTTDALEQSSGEEIAGWSARRFVGWDRIADLGCGIGGDTLALAAVPGASVIGLDRDALRLNMARANLSAYDRAADWIQADLRDPLPLALRQISAAFFDPARRDSGQRVYSVRGYLPPLDVIDSWPFEALGVKLSPGVDLDELRPYTDTGAGIEFVSRDGELKEALLWRGAFGFRGRWASRLGPDGSGETLIPLDLAAPPLSEPRAYLYEPDPAVIRAGLLSELAARLNLPMYRLDETIAYLTADTAVMSPWARCWPVWDWMPFNLKRLRARLESLGVGELTVKKRGSPIQPDDLLRQLKWRGSGRPAVVVLTQVAGRHSALVCGIPSPGI
ncbi:MAG: methyltransferase domain-containing protein [Chloroflexi bacterium]|nr:methyltransferase domain-containing protein [Chloroflexota bacterium]